MTGLGIYRRGLSPAVRQPAQSLNYQNSDTMKSVKIVAAKVLSVSFSIFLIWQSIQWTSNIIQRTDLNNIGDIVIHAILLNLFITGIFLVGYTVPLNKLLPNSYYTSVESRSFAALCAILKIDLFRKIMRLTFWSPRNNKKHFFNGRKSGLNEFERNTRISESSHTFAFVIIMVVSLFISFVGSSYLVITVTLINIIVNFYPAILQRFHRMRLQKIHHYYDSGINPPSAA